MGQRHGYGGHGGPSKVLEHRKCQGINRVRQHQAELPPAMMGYGQRQLSTAQDNSACSAPLQQCDAIRGRRERHIDTVGLDGGDRTNAAMINFRGCRNQGLVARALQVILIQIQFQRRRCTHNADFAMVDTLAAKILDDRLHNMQYRYMYFRNTGICS